MCRCLCLWRLSSVLAALILFLSIFLHFTSDQWCSSTLFTVVMKESSRSSRHDVETQKYGLLLRESTKKPKNLWLWWKIHRAKAPQHAAIFKVLTAGRCEEFCRFSITARLRPITTDSGQGTWRMIGCVSVTPPAQSARGRVDEIAGQIMLLADASLITALLSISNYTGCLAEREGRRTSYWKSLYWQYSHQAVMASPPSRRLKADVFFQPGRRCPQLKPDFILAV